jgi:hypothetical protein
VPSELKIHELSNDTTVGSHRQVLFVHFRGPTLPECGPPMRRAFRELTAKYPSLVFFAVVEEASPPPSQDARQTLADFFAMAAPKLSAAVVTYRGSGFRAAMVRTVVATVLSVMPKARFPFGKHVVGSLEEAAALAARDAPGVEAAALLAAFRELAEARPGARA